MFVFYLFTLDRHAWKVSGWSPSSFLSHFSILNHGTWVWITVTEQTTGLQRSVHGKKKKNIWFFSSLSNIPTYCTLLFPIETVILVAPLCRMCGFLVFIRITRGWACTSLHFTSRSMESMKTVLGFGVHLQTGQMGQMAWLGWFG